MGGSCMYDLIVLGAGPGGYLAAEHASEAGLKTLLLEKEHIGGVCLNEGCIPTKTLLHSAKLYHSAREGDAYGVSCRDVTLDHSKVIDRKETVIKTLVGGVQAGLKKSGAEVRMAKAVIQGRTADGIRILADGQEVCGNSMILATGSHTVIPPIPGLKEALDSGFAVTSRELLKMRTLPERLVIVGGGVIGLEMASYFALAGTQVSVVEMLPKIAGPVDEELSHLLQKDCEKQGITFYLSAKATAFREGTVVIEKDGAVSELTCDTVLVCLGRRATTQDFGVESLQLEVSRTGIVVDGQCRTTLPNVYAVGDCNGRAMLAHTAYREADVAVNTILGKRDRMRYDAIPSVIYTVPEIAAVGMTEEEARQAGFSPVVTRLPMTYSGRYLAEYGQGGMCKLVFDQQRQILLGAHIMGGPASEFIFSCGMMIETEMTASHMKEFVYPHPTVCEIIKEAIFQTKL